MKGFKIILRVSNNGCEARISTKELAFTRQQLSVPESESLSDELLENSISLGAVTAGADECKKSLPDLAMASLIVFAGAIFVLILAITFRRCEKYKKSYNL